MRQALALLLVVPLLLAGCSTPGGGDGGAGGDEAPPQQMSEAQARTLLTTAVAQQPERFGLEMRVLKGDDAVLTMKGAFDNSTGEAYVEMKGDASLLGEGAEDEASQRLLQQGITLYSTREGSLYLANGTAIVFPGSEDREATSFLPSPEDGPMGALLRPSDAFQAFAAANATLSDLRPTTLRGKAALQMDVSVPEGEETREATVTVFTGSQRVGRVEGEVPLGELDEADALRNATAIVDLLYDDEVKIVAPPAARRAIGLLYTSDAMGMGGGGGALTWTFQNSGGIALAEVEAQVKDLSNAMSNDDAGADAVGRAPTLWSMKLSEGTKTHDGQTITFTDVDADGKVSAGDTLRVEGGDSDAPQVVLFDTVTATHVVPGPGLALAVLALAALALVLRRK